MRIVLFLLFALVLVIPPALAQNELQDVRLYASNDLVTLDVEFGQDRIKELYSRNVLVPQINSTEMTFYGDVIDMSDSYLRVYDDGRLFSIKSLEQGVAIYGKYDPDLDHYKINVYLSTSDGLEKFTIYSMPGPKDTVTKDESEQAASDQYIPELKITSSHDFQTYWRETFDIVIQAFDGNLNPDPEPSDFYGRLDGADVRVSLSKDNVRIADLSGVTRDNGQWSGKYLFRENISKPGEYAVDVTVSHLGETVSESSSMFVIGTVAVSDGSNRPPIANAGMNMTIPEHDESMMPPIFMNVTLDGSKSSDPDGDLLTYLWSQTSGIDVDFYNFTSVRPVFTLPDLVDMTPVGTGDGSEDNEDLIFELRVTDSRGLESLTPDHVMITVTPMEQTVA